MSEQELKQLAVDCVEGRVFGSWMVPDVHQNKLANLFLPLSVGGGSLMPDDVWSVYEYRERALPVQFEGMPVFLSCKHLRREDAERLGQLIVAYQECQARFLG